MYYKKIMKKVKYELDNYSIIDKRIENIERNRIGNNKDINSFIKSKNKISSSVEAEVINNIEIDKEINVFLRYNRNYFYEKGYKVYFTGSKYTYKNANMTVQSNEFMVAFKEEMDEN